MSTYPKNWQNELIKSATDLVYKMEDAKEHVGKHPEIQEDYKKALNSANDTKAAISHFIGFFNQKYGD